MSSMYLNEDRRGIKIMWIPTTQTIEILGWFDKSAILTLKELFKKLHITKKDCDKAFQSK